MYGPELGTVVAEVVPDTQACMDQTALEACAIPPQEFSESNIAGSDLIQEMDSGPFTLYHLSHSHNLPDHFDT